MSEAPIRILHIVGSLGLGGTEKVMQSFVSNLSPARFSRAVFSPTDGPRAPFVRSAGVATFIGGNLFNALIQFQPHIVHLHRAGWPEPEPLRQIKRAQVPVVLETNVFGRHDPSPSAAIIDHTLFVSHFCMNRYASITKADMSPERFSVLYNPVDTDFYATHAAPDFSAPVIGRISRSDPGKWSPLALDFLPLLVKSFPNLRYRILGAIPEVEAFIDTHGLQANVELVPPVETEAGLVDFLSSISVLVHANDTGESFGLAIAEAMAAGVPVITHPAQGLRDNAQLELVDHGENGFIGNNARDYAKYIGMLLHDSDLANAMGAKGQRKAQALFRAQDIAAKLEIIYDQLLTRKGIHCS